MRRLKNLKKMLLRSTEDTMSNSSQLLSGKHCKACEGGVPRLTADEVQALLKQVRGWTTTPGQERIRKEWKVKDFATGMDFFRRVGEIAEAEGHHPDLHLVGYRNVAIEIWTHAVDGLTENDFILAAKIDDLPVALKR
jgi:4a-hydroxytetrahydrobiopterin dehydratase